MAHTQYFLLGLLTLVTLAQGSCWRYGHSCWGGHGKRSGEPPGATGVQIQSLALSANRNAPRSANRNSRVTGEYSLEEEEEEGEEELRESEERALEDAARKLNLNLSALPSSNELRVKTFFDVPETNQIRASSEDDNAGSHVVEVDLGGGEVIDPDLLEAESIDPRQVLNRARKGPVRQRRVLVYRFRRRR